MFKTSNSKTDKSKRFYKPLIYVTKRIEGGKLLKMASSSCQLAIKEEITKDNEDGFICCYINKNGGLCIVEDENEANQVTPAAKEQFEEKQVLYYNSEDEESLIPMWQDEQSYKHFKDETLENEIDSIQNSALENNDDITDHYPLKPLECRESYICVECRKTFMARPLLETHVLNVHEVPRHHTCIHCSKSFSKKDRLVAHIQKFHGGQKYVCKQCFLSFRYKESLARHFNSVHKGQRYACEHCGKLFCQKYKLNKHTESAHKVQNICIQCNQSFVNKYSLRRHIQGVHKDQERHVCEQCNSSFSRKTHLNTHIQSVHEGHRHACEQCCKLFVHKRSLVAHIEIVHEGKRYACEQCDRLFNWKRTLAKHVQLVHERQKTIPANNAIKHLVERVA